MVKIKFYIFIVVADISSDVVLREELGDALLKCTGWTFLFKIYNAVYTWFRVKTRVFVLQCIGWTLQWENTFNMVLNKALSIVMLTENKPNNVTL
jgi:hypothetical protein